MKVTYSREFNVSSFKVLCVEALRAKGVVSERQSCFNLGGVTSQVHGVMVVTESQVISLQFTVGVASVEMDASIKRQEVEGLVHDSERLVVSLLFE